MHSGDKEKLEAFITEFSRMVNGGVSRIRQEDIPELAQMINSKHRTLQSSMASVIFSMLFAMTTDDIYVDGRNRHAVDQIKKMIKGFGIVTADEEVERWKMNGLSPEEIENKRTQFLESFNGNPFIYMGIAFV